MSTFDRQPSWYTPSARSWPLVLLPALFVLFVLVMWNQGASFFRPRAEPRPVTPRGELTADEKSNIALFREAAPSVVHITTRALARDRFSLDLFEIPQGTGSGFIWDEYGHIVTNYHVIQDANRAYVTLADHSNWPAELVGVDGDKDLAVLRIDAPKDRLRPIAIGISHDLQVGQKVLAIGNPFGLDHSLSTGVISALDRQIRSPTGRTIQGAIQTDAAINQGNSGGPLLDSAGRLIGINSQIVTPSGGYSGIGFAIPVDMVNWVVPALIEHRQGVRPVLGVKIWPGLSREVGLPGVLVYNVLPGSAADKAGLRATHWDATGQLILGDVIMAINDTPIRSFIDLLNVLENHRVGDTVKVTVHRGGSKEDIQLTLEAPN